MSCKGAGAGAAEVEATSCSCRKEARRSGCTGTVAGRPGDAARERPGRAGERGRAPLPATACASSRRAACTAPRSGQEEWRRWQVLGARPRNVGSTVQVLPSESS